MENTGLACSECGVELNGGPYRGSTRYNPLRGMQNQTDEAAKARCARESREGEETSKKGARLQQNYSDWIAAWSDFNIVRRSWTIRQNGKLYT